MAGEFLADQTIYISKIKADRLKLAADNNDQASISMDALSGAPDFPVSGLTTTGQTLAMNQQPKTWMDDIQESFNFMPIQSTNRIV